MSTARIARAQPGGGPLVQVVSGNARPGNPCQVEQRGQSNQIAAPAMRAATPISTAPIARMKRTYLTAHRDLASDTASV
jgi:hypothetical protein